MKGDKTDIVEDGGFRQHTLEYPEATKEEIFEALDRFHRCSHLRPKPILRTIRTMMEDKDIFVRRCRDPFVTGPAGERRRFHLVSAACEV